MSVPAPLQAWGEGRGEGTSAGNCPYHWRSLYFRAILIAQYTLIRLTRGPPMPIINSVAAMQDEVAGWRRDIHEHPEILYEVHRTAGIVAEKLKAFGCDEV